MAINRVRVRVLSLPLLRRSVSLWRLPALPLLLSFWICLPAHPHVRLASSLRLYVRPALALSRFLPLSPPPFPSPHSFIPSPSCLCCRFLILTRAHASSTRPSSLPITRTRVTAVAARRASLPCIPRCRPLLFSSRLHLLLPFLGLSSCFLPPFFPALQLYTSFGSVPLLFPLRHLSWSLCPSLRPSRTLVLHPHLVPPPLSSPHTTRHVLPASLSIPLRVLSASPHPARSTRLTSPLVPPLPKILILPTLLAAIPHIPPPASFLIFIFLAASPPPCAP